MKQQLSITSRILVAFASGALIAVFFLPVWRIDLFAPQYPEGLTMNIWISGLSGDVDIINGLNHYIGMKPINEGMFPEFSFLPWVVAFFMLLGMIVSITGNRKFLFAYLLLTAIGGVLAMYDFWKWGKDYGSQLDPSAPIQVPGLTYQPPLIGHKRLLNFDAYSFPDVGGWVVVAAGTLAFTVWLVEWYRHRKPGGFLKKKLIPVTLLAVLFLVSCHTNPETFQPGKDHCHFCKMGITDTRFGGELITKKGKIYKFDDLICLARFVNQGGEPAENIADTYTVLFQQPNVFTSASQAGFVTDPSLRTPMGSQTAGFVSFGDASRFAKGKKDCITLSWTQFLEKAK